MTSSTYNTNMGELKGNDNSLPLFSGAVMVTSNSNPLPIDSSNCWGMLRESEVHIQQRLNPHFSSSSKLEGKANLHPAAAAPDCLSTSPHPNLPNQQHKYLTAFSLQQQALRRPSRLGLCNRLNTSVERRNARERTRVHTVNQAFVILRRILPSLSKHNKRVSKLKILRACIHYVRQLLTSLGEELGPTAAAGPAKFPVAKFGGKKTLTAAIANRESVPVTKPLLSMPEFSSAAGIIQQQHREEEQINSTANGSFQMIGSLMGMEKPQIMDAGVAEAVGVAPPPFSFFNNNNNNNNCYGNNSFGSGNFLSFPFQPPMIIGGGVINGENSSGIMDIGTENSATEAAGTATETDESVNLFCL